MIISTNIVIILMVLIFCLVNFKKKQLINPIIKLTITFGVQTLLLIGLNSKEPNISVTIFGEMLYLTYFIYQVKKLYKIKNISN